MSILRFRSIECYLKMSSDLLENHLCIYTTKKKTFETFLNTPCNKIYNLRSSLLQFSKQIIVKVHLFRNITMFHLLNSNSLREWLQENIQGGFDYFLSGEALIIFLLVCLWPKQIFK